jgi:carbamoyltransferase
VDYDSFTDVFNHPRSSYEQFKQGFQYYADIAWWVQQETSRAVQYIVQQRMQLLQGVKRLAYTGGVALNAVANAQLLRKKIVDELYMQPAAGDNGLAIGCAYYGWMHVLKNEKPTQQKSIFFGKSYGDDIILQAIEQHNNNSEIKITGEQHHDIVAVAAKALAEGKIIGWYQGGCECGPRALGHRSILADPRIKDVQLIINRDVKNREDFRPFAPSVPVEHAHKYFVHCYESPYMILVDELQEQWKGLLKGIVHVDGSCRVQTVTPDWNPEYYELLTAFGKLTGVDVLLNTSFNTRGMPIVETPAEAIDMFVASALDELYINSYRIVKKSFSF